MISLYSACVVVCTSNSIRYHQLAMIQQEVPALCICVTWIQYRSLCLQRDDAIVDSIRMQVRVQPPRSRRGQCTHGHAAHRTGVVQIIPCVRKCFRGLTRACLDQHV
jgi:hypothetical protein